MSNKYDWRFENSIINGKEISVDEDYDQWRTNNVLVNHKDIVLYVNEINKYDISDKMHYDYLFNSIRKYKRWAKPMSKDEKKKKEEEMELISLISEYYKYNTLRSKEVLKILSAEDIKIIRKRLDRGGVK